MDYFSKVKDSATEAEKEKIKKIQPNVFEVIKSLSKGKVEKAKERRRFLRKLQRERDDNVFMGRIKRNK